MRQRDDEEAKGETIGEGDMMTSDEWRSNREALWRHDNLSKTSDP
jgi:hypothetical protein